MTFMIAVTGTREKADPMERAKVKERVADDIESATQRIETWSHLVQLSRPLGIRPRMQGGSTVRQYKTV